VGDEKPTIAKRFYYYFDTIAGNSGGNNLAGLRKSGTCSSIKRLTGKQK
jgi:hypothetical protein